MLKRLSRPAIQRYPRWFAIDQPSMAAAHAASVIRRRAFELFDAERLQLSVQRRTLHANEFGGTRYVAAEPTDLSHEILALEGFPRLAKRKAQQFLAADSARHRRHQRANLRRKHGRRNFGVGIAEREDHHAFDIISELPDVSWPVVRLKHRHGVG